LDNTALEHLKRSAAETFEAAKKASEENLKSALTQKVMMDLHLDLRAPVILVPETVTRAPHTHMEEGLSDAVMVIQPGNLSVWSLKAQHLSQVSRLLCGKNVFLAFPPFWPPLVSLPLSCLCLPACMCVEVDSILRCLTAFACSGQQWRRKTRWINAFTTLSSSNCRTFM
jgi:hypothetical protein